jgi:RNA recognition motif-containing protein
MAEQTPERSAYLPPHARSQQSNNWRVKDDSPKVEQNSHFRQDRNNSKTGDNSVSVDSGSRLWVGNLLYTASREDVEQLFTANGFPPTGLSMSVDPFTQRNPSYCFLDFETAEDAARATEAMNGKELLGREIKVNPGVRRQQGDGERRTRDFNQTGGTGGSRFTRDYPRMSS